MDEILIPDGNGRNIAGAVTDDSDQYIRRLRIDDATKGLKVTIVGGTGMGTVTSISAGAGILATPDPITTTGSIALSTPLQPIATLGTALQSIRVNAGATALEYYTPSAGTGTVTSVSVVSANGFAGSVATDTTTPAITLSTTVTGILKGNGTAISAAVANTDYQSAIALTTTGTSGASTFNGTTLNIPQYQAAGTYVTAVSIATANGFSGSSSGGATPALTIVAGAITPTSVNGLTISTTTGTFTLTNAKTLAVTNTLTLSGTDSTTMTFPTTTATIARTDAGQTFTGIQTIPQILCVDNAIAASGNAATVTRSNRNNVVTNNSAAGLTITLSTTSATAGDMIIVQSLPSSDAAQTITWVNTENSDVTPSANLNASTTSPRTDGFKWNPLTSKWRCIASC